MEKKKRAKRAENYSENEIMLMSNFVNENKEKLFGRAGPSSAKVGSLTIVHIFLFNPFEINSYLIGICRTNSINYVVLM